MKKKNGFTMIEILTIIFILALLFVIYNVLSNDILNKTNDTADDLTKQMILKAAEAYVLEYRETPRDDNVTWTEEVEIKEDGTTKTSFCVSLNSLINYGYFKNDGSKFFDYKDNKAVYFEIENGVTTSKLVDLTTDNGKLNEECKYYIKNSSFTENTITNDNVEIYGGTDEIQIGSFEYDVKEIDGNKYSSSLNFKLDISPIFNQIKPINLILVLDATGSMGDEDNKLTIDSAYGKAVDAMLEFTDDILSKPTTVGSNVALIEYGQTSVVRKNITTDKLKSNHFKFKNLGYTNVGAGIDMATSLIYTNSNINTKEQLENTYVILLYDGEPTSYSECIYTKDNKSITLKTEGNTNEQESKKVPYLKELNNNQYSISANAKNCFNQNCVDVYFNNYIKGWDNPKNDNFYCKQITNTNLTTNKTLTISRSKKQTVEASNFLKSFGVKLVTLGYNFKEKDEDMKIISTNNNHLCIDSGDFETYKKDGKNYCYYEAEQGNINDLFENLLNNILIFNNSIDKVKIAVEPIKIDSKDSIVLYNKNGEKIENNKIEEELDVLDEQTIFNFSNNYYFEVNDALYEKYCTINSETNTCKIEDMKLFDVYVKIKYKSRTDYNDLNLTSPSFDLILNKAEKLN